MEIDCHIGLVTDGCGEGIVQNLLDVAEFVKKEKNLHLLVLTRLGDVVPLALGGADDTLVAEQKISLLDCLLGNVKSGRKLVHRREDVSADEIPFLDPGLNLFHKLLIDRDSGIIIYLKNNGH